LKLLTQSTQFVKHSRALFKLPLPQLEDMINPQPPVPVPHLIRYLISSYKLLEVSTGDIEDLSSLLSGKQGVAGKHGERHPAFQVIQKDTHQIIEGNRDRMLIPSWSYKLSVLK